MTNDPSAEKPVDEWVTGDEPMTGPQRSYLETLAREAGEEVPESLTKAEASVMIERLQQATGRGEHTTDSTSHTSADTTSDTSVEELEQQGIVDQQAAAQVEPQQGV